ncbi:MAG: lactonase family protein, partial [bacterium]|nr:lactonase family protein [bacterium]
MRRCRQQPRPGLACLLAWAAVVVLLPGPASPRVLEFVEQHADGEIKYPRGLTFSEDGRYLYVAGYPSVVFERDDVTGELSFVDATNGALEIAISPDGRNLYFRQGGLRTFARDPETGTSSTFLEIWHSGMEGLSSLTNAALTPSPDGRHVYVATVEGTLLVFARAGRTGALSHLATYYSGYDGFSGFDVAHDAAISPDGVYLYVASSPWDGGQGAVTVLERDASSGALTFVDSADGSGGAALGDARELLLSP